MTHTQVARQYRKENPTFPTLKLARIMYKENPLLFKDVEDARYKLRYIEGKVGSTKKKNVVNTEFLSMHTLGIPLYIDLAQKDIESIARVIDNALTKSEGL